ncbi:MAG: transposase-like protein [Marivirga sp.]|jgi:transposase-like protein
MEKSTKNRIIKKPEYYSEEFKWQVVQEVLSGRLTKEAARRAYNITGKCTILY